MAYNCVTMFCFVMHPRFPSSGRNVNTSDTVTANNSRQLEQSKVRYFRNLSNIDDRVRNISWQTLNLTQTLTLTLTQTLTLILTLTPTLTIYIHIHIHGHLGLTACRNSVWQSNRDHRQANLKKHLIEKWTN